MPKAATYCSYHPGILIPDKFSTCGRCAAEFFKRHGIPYDEKYYAPADDGNIEVVSLDDIIEELDDIITKDIQKKGK